MKSPPRAEDGITPTVKTVFSRYTVRDIFEQISSGKTDAVLHWLDVKKLVPKKSLVIGAYRTGSHLANVLVKRSPVTLLDIYPHISYFLDHEVSFETVFSKVEKSGWDFVMDTSGLGGISAADLGGIETPAAFLVENPCTDGSDAAILATSRHRALLEAVKASHRGFLYTYGVQAKTSGTMTLTLEVIFRAIQDACREEGVLYATSSLEFYERILFKQQDAARFVALLDRPALVVSTLKEIDCDVIIEKNLSRITSVVIDYLEGEGNEGRSVLWADRKKDSLGPVVRGRPGWFYRPW